MGKKEMEAWGLQNVTLEPSDLQARGWAAESFSVEMLSPRYAPIVAWPAAFTKSTDGVLTGVPLFIKLELDWNDPPLDSLQKYRGKLKEHFLKISAYFNLDGGSGKIRGIYLQGNEALRPVFETYLAPFGYLGANTLSIENTSYTDHEILDALHVPAFQFIQDPLNYSTVTHHTNLDVYENVIEVDMKQNAVIIAALAYQVTMRDEMLPGKDD